MLAGIWCSELEICDGNHIFCDCIFNGSSIIFNIQRGAICCGNKEYTNTPSQNKNGIWCSDISTSSSTGSMYIGTLTDKYYCNNYVLTFSPRTYQKCKNKFNVLMSILGFILNE